MSISRVMAALIFAIATPLTMVWADALAPVPRVLPGRLDVRTDRGRGELPIQVSRDWTRAQPGVTRAVIVIHGWSRRDLSAGERALAKAGAAGDEAIVITPQFLIQADITAHNLSDDVLRWRGGGWKDGYDARGSAPLSAFDALDTILMRLADPGLFPNLRIVVVAGHSAGGQFVQRYAAIRHGQGGLLKRGIHIRYVVANPSSYLYFTAARPHVSTDTCARVNRWNYGLDGGLPRYVSVPIDPAAVEKFYRRQDVVYLLGTADVDPTGHDIDQSCAAEAQGATRFERGLDYWRYVASKATTEFDQRLLEVSDVGHSSSQMFTSVCGLSALFDMNGCDAP